MEKLYIIPNTRVKRKSIKREDDSPENKSIQLEIQQMSLDNFAPEICTGKTYSKSLYLDLQKAGVVHLPKGAKRFTYTPVSEYGVIYIPTNRLNQVYQTSEATDSSKVKDICEKLKQGKKLEPVEIGYNYDIHDGHHRWEACKKCGYTHVPCIVKGTDPDKVQTAKEKYRKLWKSDTYTLLVELNDKCAETISKSLCGGMVLQDILANIMDEYKAIESYETLLLICDDFMKPIVEEIMEDEKDHFKNLSVLLQYVSGVSDPKKLKKQLAKSLNLPLVLDLCKATLNTSKLVRKRVPVKGKDGKVFYRMQWVDPNKDKQDSQVGGKKQESTEYSYMHDDSGIAEKEKRLSNKYPIRYIPVKELKNKIYNYSPDKKAIMEARSKFDKGEKLPPVTIDADGEILDNHHLVDMAKELGLTHIPTLIMGNPKMKKDLEDKWKEPVFMDEEDDKGVQKQVQINKTYKNQFTDNSVDKDSVSQEVINDMTIFDNVTTKLYGKAYLMEQARNQDIVWKEFTNDGRPLPANSNILWMNAYKAIESHILHGGKFVVDRDEKEIDRKMKEEGKDSVHKHFLKLLESFNGDKSEMMNWCESHGHSWKYNVDPSKNWMNFVATIKKELASGKSINGVRTKQKQAMTEANLVITDQIRAKVKGYGQKYGKATVMSRADTLGIVFDKEDSRGELLPMNSPILWMRASESIQKYVARGNEFTMGEKAPEGIQATVGDNGSDNLTVLQKVALDRSKRNNQNTELTYKNYMKKCFALDYNLSPEQAEEKYESFRENARNARVMLHFDPLEKLPSGVTLIEQFMSDGFYKNDLMLKRGLEQEHLEANEFYTFGRDFDSADSDERPVYGCIDLYNQGLGSNSLGGGSVAFVVKKDSDVMKRATGCYTNGDNIPYGEDGNWVRSLQDPHQLAVDRWYSKWKTPHKADGQRKKAMNSIVSGTAYKEDNSPFEAHIHGKLEFNPNNIEYMLAPKSWETSKTDAHSKLQEFSKLTSIPIKYE